MVRSSLSVLLLSLGACAFGGRPLPTPLPPSDGPLPARETLIEIGRRQAYDPNPGASDRAEIKDGIQVTIEPQDGAYRNTRARLAKGAIVAQFHNHSQRPVPEYALQPGGRSFWVVYKKGDQWLSAYIADSKNRELDRFDLPTLVHPPTRPWRQSIAQWQLGGVLQRHDRPGGESAMAATLYPWATCDDGDCCKVGPPDY